VIFCLDRAGIVGEDGPTHHGLFDIAFLRCIPNLTIYTPSSLSDLQNILYTVQKEINGPIAIRYPRGRGFTTKSLGEYRDIQTGKGKTLLEGEKIAVLSIGTIVQNAQSAIAMSKLQVGLFDMQFVCPLDTKLIDQVLSNYEHIITIEDGIVQGGFGSAVLEYISTTNYKGNVHLMGVDNHFPSHGTIQELQYLAGLSSSKIAQKILAINN